MACSVAGITSDANVLTNQLRLYSQRHMLHYGEPIPCEQLVASLCDIKQAYTQFGGLCFKTTDICLILCINLDCGCFLSRNVHFELGYKISDLTAL